MGFHGTVGCVSNAYVVGLGADGTVNLEGGDTRINGISFEYFAEIGGVPSEVLWKINRGRCLQCGFAAIANLIVGSGDVGSIQRSFEGDARFSHVGLRIGICHRSFPSTI